MGQGQKTLVRSKDQFLEESQLLRSRSYVVLPDPMDPDVIAASTQAVSMSSRGTAVWHG